MRNLVTVATAALIVVAAAAGALGAEDHQARPSGHHHRAFGHRSRRSRPRRRHEGDAAVTRPEANQF